MFSLLWCCGLSWMFMIQSSAEDGAVISKVDVAQFAKSHTEFGLDLYKNAANDAENDNIFFSPLSISFALGLLHLGAKGSSLEQIDSALHFNKELKQQFHLIQSYLSTLLHDSKSYNFQIVSRLYGDRTYSFLQQFLDATKKSYGSELEKVDFANNAESARNLINEWVSSQTNRKITDLIPRGVIDSMTKLVLVNAIYFKGQWLNQFDETLTKEDEFYLSNGEAIKIHFMRRRDIMLQYSVAPNLHAEVLELPFTEHIAFYVVLPNRDTSLKDVEDLLTSDILASLKFETSFVNVWLPRFEINQKFKLKDYLKSIGIKHIFDRDTADLSGIDGTRQLSVSDALHKAFIKLDENGVEAAAATAFNIELRSAPFDVVDFKADRPFFFYLKDQRTNIISFIGRFSKA